jgi:hypothetical protein
MRDRVRCSCQRCIIRNLMGPAIVITLGLLFLLQELRGGWLDFANTYPILLLVIGGILLASSVAPMDGHINSSVAPVPPPPGTGTTPPTPSAGQGL